MAFNFGIDSKILRLPIYNLGYALPFICAFYVMNTADIFHLPFGFNASGDTARVLQIVSVTFYYFIFVVFAGLASQLSLFIEDSKLTLIFTWIVFIEAIQGALYDNSQPLVSIYFILLSAIVLAAKHLGLPGNISFGATSLVGAITSILCLTSGVLWTFNDLIFKTAVMAGLGLHVNIAPSSTKVGAIMLLSLGYVLFYGVFKINEVENES